MLYIGTYIVSPGDKRPYRLMEIVRQRIAERGLTSHMNNSKWRALCTAIYEELPFAPAYQEKLVVSDAPYPEELASAPHYNGDWARTPEASLGLFTEWLKVAPRRTVRQGRQLAPHIEDCSDAFRDILIRLRVPFTEEDGFFTIYGHSTSAVFLDRHN